MKTKQRRQRMSETIAVEPGATWIPEDPKGFDGVFRNALDGRVVIISIAKRSDGRIWQHVSVSHPCRIPTYNELAEVKRRFVGRDRKAVMVFPAEDKHVNIHANALHLFSCLGEDPLPEFSGMIGGVRTI